MKNLLEKLGIHFHNWTPWSKPYRKSNHVYDYSYQSRYCRECNKVEERFY